MKELKILWEQFRAGSSPASSKLYYQVFISILSFSVFSSNKYISLSVFSKLPDTL